MAQRNWVATTVVALGAFGCGSPGEPTPPPPPPPPPAVATVDVTPASATLTVGEHVTLAATARTAAGAAVTGRTVAWTSGSPAVASVDQTGAVTAVSPGSATISATVEGKAGTASVAVSAAVAAVVVTPDSVLLHVGETTTLTARATDASGATLPAVPVTWQSTRAAVASVSGTGLVTAVSGGRAAIIATAGTAADTAAAVVVPDPLAVTLSASAVTENVGVTGGTLTVAGAGGVQYALAIPPFALDRTVAITVRVIDTVRGLPLSGGFRAGVDMQPSGLTFAVPAKLTMIGIAAPAGALRPVGFGYTGTGAEATLVGATVSGTTIELPVSHFSGTGIGFGTAEDVQAYTYASGSTSFYLLALLTASMRTPRDTAFEIQVVEDWYDDVVEPAVDSAGDDHALFGALTEYQTWLSSGANRFPGRSDSAFSIVRRKAGWMDRFATKARVAIDANKQLCLNSADANTALIALDNARWWYRTARQSLGSYADTRGINVGWFRLDLCATAVPESVSPAVLRTTGTESIDLQLGLRLLGVGGITPANFRVLASASDGTLDRDFGLTGGGVPGSYTTVFGATGNSPAATFTACYAGLGSPSTERPMVPDFDFEPLCLNAAIGSGSNTPFPCPGLNIRIESAADLGAGGGLECIDGIEVFPKDTVSLDLRFPALKIVGSILLGGASIRSFEAPQLQSLQRLGMAGTGLVGFVLPALEFGGQIEVDAVPFPNRDLVTIAFPRLKRVNNFGVGRQPELASLDVPCGVQANFVSILSNPKLSTGAVTSRIGCWSATNVTISGNQDP